ncbi:MarR family winged helix-turn-helix transcriptional regulator [Diplocloster agilis]|uniref:MarR family transcriptional regulator n=1 Tax=Diplocloster agilis TaxID=2850323 RepID=A0A949JW48_9FIRM|nr:MarR family transcriptional regulator [Diplocloster agilis]MBU9735189.1 MarR family transcriptional regulator [Diplocloster agilis]MBU9743587.1 MarR family transcriptional regulator [Diplocloster agilis]
MIPSPSDILLSNQYGSKVYEKFQESVCDKYKLTKMELDILMFLYNNPEKNNASDIVKVRMLTKSHVSISIASLVKKKYLARTPSGHGRMVYLELSSRAEEVVQEGLAMQQRFWNVMFAGFPEEDRERFGKYLQKIAENLNTAYQEGIRNQ